MIATRVVFVVVAFAAVWFGLVLVAADAPPCALEKWAAKTSSLDS
jgi:hypothetical protein